MSTHKSIVGTANVPVGVIRAPGTEGPSTGVIKLCGMPLLFLISGTIWPKILRLDLYQGKTAQKNRNT